MSQPRHIVVAASALMMVACVDDGFTGDEAQLLVPDHIAVQWDDSFNGEADGLGALIPVDLMVYEGGSGEPLGQVDLRLDTDIDVINDGAIDVLASDCLDCVWDSGRDRYVDWGATTSSVQTDDDGLARVYLWIDAFAGDQPLTVDVEMGRVSAPIEVERD